MGLACRSDAASGGHTALPRRSASSRSVSAWVPNRTSTLSGWSHRSAASTTRLGSAVLRSWRVARNEGPASAGSACSSPRSAWPTSMPSMPPRSWSAGPSAGSSTSWIRSPSLAPADRLVAPSTSQSAGSATVVGPGAANAGDATVSGAAAVRTSVSAIASHSARTSASGDRTRIGRDPGTGSAWAVAGKASPSRPIQARSAGSSGPARHTSSPSGPTVGRSRPRASRPRPAVAAADHTRALAVGSEPGTCSAGPIASSSGIASASSTSSARCSRRRTP